MNVRDVVDAIERAGWTVTSCATNEVLARVVGQPMNLMAIPSGSVGAWWVCIEGQDPMTYRDTDALVSALEYARVGRAA